LKQVLANLRSLCANSNEAKRIRVCTLKVYTHTIRTKKELEKFDDVDVGLQRVHLTAKIQVTFEKNKNLNLFFKYFYSKQIISNRNLKKIKNNVFFQLTSIINESDFKNMQVDS
jgi:hypothetical protein